MSEDESARESEALNTAFVPFERYQRCLTTFDRLEALRHRFKANFGADAAVPFGEIRNVLNKIFFNAERYGRLLKRRPVSEGAAKRYEADRKDIEAAIWCQLDGPDEIAAIVDEAVRQIEVATIPHLRN